MSAERAKTRAIYVETLEPHPAPAVVFDQHPPVGDHLSGIEEDIRFMFREAVADSLANLLDVSEARAMVAFMGGTSLEDPERVYGALDSILQRGAHVLKDAIAEEFHAKVDLLKRKLEEDPDSVIWVAKFVQKMEGRHLPSRRA